MSAETDKQSAEPEKPDTESGKPSAEPEKPKPEPVRSSAEENKPKSKVDKQTQKMRILIGALILAAIGFIYTLFHTFEVLKEAQDPYAQSVRAIKGLKPLTEAQLEKEEQQLQPKNPAPLSKDSPYAHTKN